MIAVRQTAGFTLRHLRTLWRQPAFVVITLMSPLLWLLLFSQLFSSVAQIPGFTGSYLDYMVPGLVVMTAVSSAGWTGMTFVEDINGGVMDRLLVSPVWRGSLNAGLLAQTACVNVVQSLIIVGIALMMGAHFAGGVAGIAVMIAVAVLAGSIFAALSNGFAMVVRRRESVIGAVSMITTPLTFLSSIFMRPELLPGWIRSVSAFNPVNWAAEAARAVAGPGADWAAAGSRALALGAVVLVAVTLATRAFRAYQRSM